ncbi:MAG: hypothetical protein K9L82_19540 [Chromatiaceae bacterium]|nr:hypothetical protein [Chromatiaceae bacterium]
MSKHSVSTVALNSIQGLDSLDWLILDCLSDTLTILEHADEALKDSLLIQVCVAFQPTHERQSTFDQLQHWAGRHGFRFYRFVDMAYASDLTVRTDNHSAYGSELITADALFLPDHARMAALSDAQRLKLAFLLHTVFNVKDLTYALLAEVDAYKAEYYLLAQGMVTESELAPELAAGEKALADAEPMLGVDLLINDTVGMDGMGEAAPGREPSVSIPDAPFMSPSERQLFKRCLKQATSYFEFGAGGSTVSAVCQGLIVQGVESDPEWVEALKAKLGEACQLEVVDIGPTGDWGIPTSKAASARFPDYSRAIQAHDKAFDLILVDGRFRVACSMMAIQHLLDKHPQPRKARIFIHDFWNRPSYHVVLQFLDVVEQVDTAGVFRVKADLDRAQIEATWKMYAKQPG